MRDKLHWLRAGKCVDFKLCHLQAVHGLAPDYIAEMCLPVGSVEARQCLRSSTAGTDMPGIDLDLFHHCHFLFF